MGSELRSVREAQKTHYEDAIQKRRKLLIDRGVDPAGIRKDPYLKHLQAGLRKTKRRLASVDALEKQKEALALRKQKRLEEKTAEEPPDAPEEAKKKPKKDTKDKKKKES
jgi:hypothetical protein